MMFNDIFHEPFFCSNPAKAWFLSRSFSKVSSLVAWDADVDVNLTAPMAAISAEHVLVLRSGDGGRWGK